MTDTLLSIGGLMAVGVGGALAVFYYFDKERRERKKEADSADDRLINLLQETIKELDKKVQLLTDWKTESEKEMAGLRAENQTLIRVLQGRDRESEDYRKSLLDSIRIGNETYTFAKATNDQMVKLTGLLEQHFKIMEVAAGTK